MPSVDNLSIPIWLDPIPYDVPTPVELMGRSGMSPASVLFHAPFFTPLVCRTISTAIGKTQAGMLAGRYRDLMRSTVTIDDGVILLRGCVVLSASSMLKDAGLVVGGNAAGDRWEVLTTWAFLPDASLDERA